MTRPDVPIPTSPQPPYPIIESNISIVAGFGRGSAELGIPTANVSTQEVKEVKNLDPGVYFGWAKVHKKNDATHSEIKARESGKEVEYSYGLGLEDGKDLEVSLPTVMSIGWNPFYGNKEKAIELHIVHEFPKDFYGATVSFNVLGYIRPELNYTTKGKWI
jgi:riboflavin kinase